MQRTRTYYSTNTRAQMVAEYRAGSSAADDFATLKGIKPTTFRNWLRRRKAKPAPRGTGTLPVKFVAVETDADRAPAIEIRVGELIVRVPSAVGAAFVAELVMWMRKSC